MSRKATGWFREQDGFYNTTFCGKQVKLSQDKDEDERAFHALHASVSEEPEAGGYRPTFRKLADLYLDFTQQAKSEQTYAHQRYFLQLFCDHLCS